MAEWLRRGYDEKRIHKLTNIDTFFLDHIKAIVSLEKVMIAHPMDLQILVKLKHAGFADSYIARKWKCGEVDLYLLARQNGITPVYKMVDTCAGEFASMTPYYYSTYEKENESVVSKNKKIIVLGSGPIRIGQGVEFDYATVHCIETLHKEGYEAIIINNNPETVSTDFAISDKLYFEPLTVEDVMHVVDLEKPEGIIVQFGGQTAINLAGELERRGCHIMGSSLEAINRAEDRHEFEKMLESLGIPQPEGDTAVTVDRAIEIANRIGYPVLVRPSYVLGGRAMEIVYDDEELKYYMETAVKEISHDSPILIDRYVLGKELEIDAVADGNEVLIPGVMEHIERAGIHSGDSISVYPPQNITKDVKDTIIDYAMRIGKGFGFIGLYNIQFIVDKDDRVYVLEVNPRSSRTVPFLSKITGVPMCQAATRCILGESIRKQGYEPGYKKEKANRVYVKAPVFSFAKLRSVDTVLGPEMKSTGEALGADGSLEKALYKALIASGVRIPQYGSVLLTISDEDKTDALKLARRFSRIGYGIYATAGTAKYLENNGLFVHSVCKISEDENNNVLNLIQEGKVSFVINTVEHRDKRTNLDGFLIRRVSAENNISCMTSLDTAEALIKVLESMSFQVVSMDEER